MHITWARNKSVELQAVWFLGVDRSIINGVGGYMNSSCLIQLHLCIVYIMYYPFSPAGFFVNLGVLCLTQPPPPQLPHPINKLMALSTPYLLMKRKGSIQEVYCVTTMLIWLMVYGTNVQYQPHSDLKWFVKFLKSSTKKVTRGERIRVSVTCSWENFKYSKRKKKPKWNMS